jgi:hypothetical protein
MTLKEFINEYVEGNSLVRVLYKYPGGHKIVLNDWGDVAGYWEIVRGKGKYAPYINHKVLGIASISVKGPYSEAINIVIEEIPLDKLREDKINTLIQ